MRRIAMLTLDDLKAKVAAIVKGVYQSERQAHSLAWTESFENLVQTILSESSNNSAVVQDLKDAIPVFVENYFGLTETEATLVWVMFFNDWSSDDEHDTPSVELIPPEMDKVKIWEIYVKLAFAGT